MDIIVLSISGKTYTTKNNPMIIDKNCLKMILKQVRAFGKS